MVEPGAELRGSTVLKVKISNTSFIRYPTIDSAKTASKKLYDFCCVLSDRPGRQADKDNGCVLVGAHLYPAGSYGDLKYYRENIFPIAWDLHTGWPGSFDQTDTGERSPIDRFRFLSLHVHYNHRQRVREQLNDLLRLLDYKGYQLPILGVDL